MSNAYAVSSCLFVLSLVQLMRCARIDDYDGSSSVTLSGVTVRTSKDWELAYNMPAVCDRGSYNIEMEIAIVTTTPHEADLVFGIGDGAKYFAGTIAYDLRGIIVNWETGEVASLGVAPNSGDSLLSGDLTSIDVQDWRNSLVNSDATLYESLNTDVTSDMCGNSSPLKIKIESDGSSTTVTFTKGSSTNSITYADGFAADSTPTLFLAPDNADTEIFTLSSISTTVQDCPVQCASSLETYIDQCYCSSSSSSSVMMAPKPAQLRAQSSVLTVRDVDMIIAKHNAEMTQNMERKMLYMVVVFAAANFVFWMVFANKRESAKKLSSENDEKKPLLSI